MTRNRAIALGVSLVIGIAMIPVGLHVKKAAAQDPTFCTNCHQMDDAFSAWSDSSHHEITCVKCHEGDLATDLKHGWLAMMGQQDVRSEAHVDEAICKGCHMEGQSETWPLVAATAGHTVHRTGDGTTCTSCHGTSLHQLESPVDVCQGCHAEHIDIEGMAALHCLDCHAFLAEKADLTVDATTCRSCHTPGGAAPSPEAHGTLDCLTCHAPHDQAAGRHVGCVECHDQDLDRHAGTGVACNNCHAPHTLAHEGKTRCKECHSQPAHGGRFGCQDCHGGHGHGAKRTCASCHTERAGLHARWSHQVCADCHGSHGEHPEPAQCLQCHGTLADDHAQVGCEGCHRFDR